MLQAGRRGPQSYSVLRDPPIFIDWSGISWWHHFKGSDHVPVTALRIVAGLSDGISRRQAFGAPLFGHNVLVASHDENFGVSGHCKSRSVHAADTQRGNPCEEGSAHKS